MEQVFERVRGWLGGKAFATAAALLLIGALGWRFFQTPIVSWDSDLWYHLAHGAKILETRELPTTTSFSFLAPDRPITDYYWLFQVLVALVFAQFDFVGLIALRAIVFVATIAAVWDCLTPVGASVRERWTATVLAMPVALVLAARDVLVRPHMIVYGLLALCMLALVKRRRGLLLLPLIGLVWVNVHGVSYPVLLMVCGAVVVDYLARRLHDEAGVETGALVAVLLTCVSVLATPHGRALLPVPFTPTDFAQVYIAELRPPTWAEFLDFDLAGGLRIEPATLLLLGLAMVAAVTQHQRLRRNPTELLLVLGGVVLLARSSRFCCEVAILVLPLLARLVPILARKSLATVVVPAVGMVLAAGAGLVHFVPGSRYAWPVSAVRTPAGIAAFLSRDPLPATVMHDANPGGYLLWRLPSNFRITMDMEIPFVFWDEDLFATTGFFRDPVLFDRVIAQHRPTYILAPGQLGQFDLIARAEQYQAVFFDDYGVLYADRNQRPQLRPLRAIDPWQLADGARVPKLPGDVAAAWLEELKAVLEVAPRVDAANQVAAVLLSQAGRFAEAEPHARASIENAPAVSAGYLMLGDALAGQGRDQEALGAYRTAMAWANDPSTRTSTRLALGYAYLRAGDDRRGFDLLVAAEKHWDFHSSTDELEGLGVVALRLGEVDIGRNLLRFALLRLPPEPSEQRARIEALLAQ